MCRELNVNMRVWFFFTCLIYKVNLLLRNLREFEKSGMCEAL